MYLSGTLAPTVHACLCMYCSRCYCSKWVRCEGTL